jgi:hypothetical protein
MKRAAVSLVVGTLIVLWSSSASADITEPGSPQYANNILSDFVTPTVRPGDTVWLAFNISNPYDDPNATMTNMQLTVGVYRYATQEEVRDVDDNFSDPPTFENGEPETTILYPMFAVDGSARVNLNISTDRDTPHGSYFSQSTYFLRFSISFNFTGNSTVVVLKSRGFFSDEQWNQMVSFEPEGNLVNLTYMKSLGVDGLIPDSSFGIKVPIPRWPLGLLIGGCCLTAFMALYYFVMDNPGKYPKLEKRLYHLRGKLSELRGKLQHRLRK